MTFALVTGASRGIGQAISERLIKQGFYVIGTATSEGGAQTISDRLGSNGEGRIPVSYTHLTLPTILLV